MGQLSDLPRATLDLITPPLELQQRASSRRIRRTARPLAPTAASSMPAMCIARPSRRSCSRCEQVGRLAVVFGGAVERRSKARPCEASLRWVGWPRKSSVWHAVSTPSVASFPWLQRPSRPVAAAAHSLSVCHFDFYMSVDISSMYYQQLCG